MLEALSGFVLLIIVWCYLLTSTSHLSGYDSISVYTVMLSLDH